MINHPNRSRQRTAVRYVPIETDDGRLCHAAEAVGNYGSLCGISIDDDPANGRAVPLMLGERIDCPTCIAIIRAAKQYRETDFCPSKRGAY